MVSFCYLLDGCVENIFITLSVLSINLAVMVGKKGKTDDIYHT